MTLRVHVAGYQDEQSVHTRALRRTIDALLQRTRGEVVVDFDPNIAARGRKVIELLELVRSGDIDLCYFSSSYLTGRVPALGALDIPFLPGERAHTRSLLDGAVGTLLAQEVAERTEYEVLAFWDNGLRNISNRLRPIRAPGDCAGLRIRTLPNAGYHATFRALGMEPVTIDVADMVRAVAGAEVDAQENPLTNIRLFGLDRHHRFVTMTGHFHGIALVLGNARSLARWPAEIRSHLRAALAEGTAAQWMLASQDETAARTALVAAGVDIIDLDQAARMAFERAVAEVADQAFSMLPPALPRLLGRLPTLERE